MEEADGSMLRDLISERTLSAGIDSVVEINVYDFGPL
jgi:hypothetical protein